MGSPRVLLQLGILHLIVLQQERILSGALVILPLFVAQTPVDERSRLGLRSCGYFAELGVGHTEGLLFQSLPIDLSHLAVEACLRVGLILEVGVMARTRRWKKNDVVWPQSLLVSLSHLVGGSC